MTPAEQRVALDEVAGKLTAAIRTLLIAPGEVAVTTIERIRADNFTPDVAAHAIEQLRELAEALDQKLASDTQAIARLGNILRGFEIRLGQMSKRYVRPGRA
jgi:hypothetical protein